MFKNTLSIILSMTLIFCCTTVLPSPYKNVKLSTANLHEQAIDNARYGNQGRDNASYGSHGLEWFSSSKYSHGSYKYSKYSRELDWFSYHSSKRSKYGKYSLELFRNPIIKQRIKDSLKRAIDVNKQSGIEEAKRCFFADINHLETKTKTKTKRPSLNFLMKCKDINRFEYFVKEHAGEIFYRLGSRPLIKSPKTELTETE